MTKFSHHLSENILINISTITTSTRLPIHKIPIIIKSSTHIVLLSYDILHFTCRYITLISRSKRDLAILSHSQFTYITALLWYTLKMASLKPKHF